VVRRHLLPQLRPLVPVLLAFELSAALLILTELGFLGIFIGGGTIYQFDSGGISATPVLTSNTPELAQQISRFWTKFYRVPWEFLAVGALIFAQIVTFNLVGEGLRRRLILTQPRSRRWLWVPDRVLDRVPQLHWRWVSVGAVVAALVVGTWVYARPRAVLPTDQLQAGTNASAIPLSDDPLPAEQLSAVDVEALLAQPGLLPERMTISQVSKRVPDQFGDVPPPIQARNVSLKAAGVSAGNIIMLFYPTTEERDRAMYTIFEAQVGEGFSAGGVRFSGSALGRQCSVLVQVRLVSNTNPSVRAEATAVAQALEMQLAPHVCQPADAQAAQASPGASASYGNAPRSADELAALDLEVLMAQPGLLLENTTIGHVSTRVPDRFRAVPPPLQTRNFSLKESGVSVGNIVVLLYSSLEEHDRAAQTMQAATAALGIGDAGSGTPVFSGSSMVVRCGAVVQVRLVRNDSTSLQADAMALAQALEAQLAPHVCQPADAPVGTNADARVAARPTTPLPAEQFRAGAPEALTMQADLLASYADPRQRRAGANASA